MELDAPARWRCVDFISDLHLQASDALTFQAWSTYLQHTQADAVFILGDLFEVWIGDDILCVESGFELQCADVLRKAAGRLDLYIMCGNRDFLMGTALTEHSCCTLLEDPCVLSFVDQRWLLTHGDALCLADTEYMQFRTLVRSADWQRDFLQKPLIERIALARAMRDESEARKRSDAVYADVDSPGAQALLQSVQSTHMIHGHTHRPARHHLAAGSERLVLSDWDLCARPPRAEVLRLRRASHGAVDSFTLERIPPGMSGGLASTMPRPED